MVAFIPGYHKGYKKGRRTKIVHRYVPQEVGEIAVYYMWLVEPFVRSLPVLARQQLEGCPWLWQPRPEDRWSHGEAEDEEEESGEAAEPSGSPDEDEGEWSDADEDWLGGTAPQTAEVEAKNVDGLYDTDRVRRVMYRETEDRIGVRIGVAMWRHVYPAIQRAFSHDAEIHDVLDDI